jgi:hypothetical protein
MVDKLAGDSSPNFTDAFTSALNMETQNQMALRQQQAQAVNQALQQKIASAANMASQIQAQEARAREAERMAALTKDNFYDTDENNKIVMEEYVVPGPDGMPVKKQRPKSVFGDASPYGTWKEAAKQSASGLNGKYASPEQVLLEGKSIMDTFESGDVIEATNRYNQANTTDKFKIRSTWEMANPGKKFKVTETNPADITKFKKDIGGMQDAKRMTDQVVKAYDIYDTQKPDFTKKGVSAKVFGGLEWAAGKAGFNDEASFYDGMRDTVLSAYAKSIGKEVGTLSDQDLARAKQWIPAFGDSSQKAKDKLNRLMDYIEQSAKDALRMLPPSLTEGSEEKILGKYNVKFNRATSKPSGIKIGSNLKALLEKKP